jgi:hypothetical protein
MDFVVDLKGFSRALRKLSPELQRETRRRLAGIVRRERDRIRGDWPGPGPNVGGHSVVAVTSGTDGLAPYLALKRNHPRHPQVGWLIFGGRRPRDRSARIVPPDGHAFYPGVKRARRQAADEVYAALQDAKRRAGL